MTPREQPACATCGEPGECGDAACANCWEVERRLESYLRSAKGRAFVKAKLPKRSRNGLPAQSRIVRGEKRRLLEDLRWMAELASDMCGVFPPGDIDVMRERVDLAARNLAKLVRSTPATRRTR